MIVSKCITKDSLVLSPKESLEDLVFKILDGKQTTAVVVDDQNFLIGMVGIHDIFKKILPSYVKMGRRMGLDLGAVIHEGYFKEKFEKMRNQVVEDFMTPEVDFLSPDDSVIHAVSDMVKLKRKALPVVSEEGKFLGMVTRRSILQGVLPKEGES